MTTQDTTAGTGEITAVVAVPAGSVTLDTPIRRAGGDVLVVQVRTPRAGELRGLSLASLLQMEVTALQAVLPRITQPTLTKPEVEAMDPADLLQLGTEVANFLLPRAVRSVASQGE